MRSRITSRAEFVIAREDRRSAISLFASDLSGTSALTLPPILAPTYRQRYRLLEALPKQVSDRFFEGCLAGGNFLCVSRPRCRIESEFQLSAAKKPCAPIRACSGSSWSDALRGLIAISGMSDLHNRGIAGLDLSMDRACSTSA